MKHFYRSLKTLLTLALLATVISTYAAYVKNIPTEIRQPDGVVLKLLASGDERYNWIHDQNNYTIVKNKATGYYVYADKQNGRLVPTSLIVGKSNPASAGLKPGLLDDASYIEQKAAKSVYAHDHTNARTAAQPAVRPGVGTYNNIVVYIQFSDQTTQDWSITRTEAESRFNGTGIVSVKDYFAEVSNNQLNLVSSFYPTNTGTTILSYTDSHPRTYYQKDTPDGYANDPEGSAGREHRLLKAAINYVASQVPSSLVIDGNNDGFVDNVTFVIKGYTEGWAELLWPHRWALFTSGNEAYINGKQVYDYNMVFSTSLGVGVISHEMFHSFGAPDLYRYSSWSSISEPVGIWDVMASNDWNRPQHMSVYLKQRYGTWISQIPELTATGTYTLQPVSSSSFAGYKIALPNSSDYLVVEYRRRAGKYEIGLPSDGLIIYRVNENGNNPGGPTDEMYVFRPDGTPTVNGDAWNATFSADVNRTAFNDNTNPFCFLTSGAACGFYSGLGISNISTAGNTITFNFTAPGTGCTTPAWNAATAYTTNQEVSYNGIKYRAKWWTQGERPDLNTGDGKPWLAIGACANENIAPVTTITSPANNSTFSLGETITITANATDADGTIDRVEFLNNGNQVLDTDAGQPWELSLTGLAAGTYTYKARSYDNLGAVSNVATVTFNVIQTDAPSIVITSPLDQATIYQYASSPTPINVTVDVNDEVAVIDSVWYIVVDVLCNNAPGCAQTRRFSKKTAPYTLSLDPIFSSGGYTEIYALAFSGPLTTSSSYHHTVYFRALPELTIVSPANGTLVNPSTTSNVLIDVTVNSNLVPIDSVVYTVTDVLVQGQAATYNNRKFKVTAAPFDLNLPILSGYTHTNVHILAYGRNGQFSQTKSLQLIYNTNQLPNVVITAPTAGAKYNVGGSITVTANVTDPDGTISTVEIYSPHIPNSSVILTAPPYTATFNNLPSSGQRGATTFVVKATDNRGGINGANIDVIENRTPVVTITAPVPVNGINPKYVVGGNVTISATATDPDGTISKVEISSIQIPNSLRTITAAPYTTTYTNLPAPAPDGSLGFTVKAYDNNGGTTSVLVILYKNRIPTVSITAPANNATFTAGSNITITSLVYDPDMTSGKVEFFRGTTKIGEVTSAPYNFTWNNVPAGNYALTAVVTDDMNQTGTSSVVNIVVNGATCSTPAWNAATAYTTGQRASKNGTIYEAKWWTQNEDPATHSGQWDVWKVIGPCNARQASAEAVDAAYAYPMPFSEQLSVEVGSEFATVELFDSYGVKVAQAEGNGQVTMNTANLASGLYFCKVSVSGITKSVTVTKQ